MKRKNKPLLKLFIFLIIWILLFSVIWVIITSLWWTGQQQAAQQEAYQQVLDNIAITATWANVVITGAVDTWDNWAIVLTGS